MDFSFIHITDHHLTETETGLLKGFSPAYAFRAVMRHIAQTMGERADFVVSTGDLVHIPSESAYRTLGQMLKAHPQAARAPGPLQVSFEGLQQFPMYFLPGNHDDREHFFRSLFPHTPPQALMNVAFTHKGIQFICLDWGPKDKGVAYPEMLRFLVEALKTDQPSILLMHHACVSVGSRWLDEFLADKIEQFRKIIAGQNVLGIFCGHAHMTYERKIENIPVFGLRSTAFQFALQDDPLFCLLPPHYRLVKVQAGTLTTQVFEVPL